MQKIHEKIKLINSQIPLEVIQKKRKADDQLRSSAESKRILLDTKNNVLVVDDNMINQKLLRKILEKEGEFSMKIHGDFELRMVTSSGYIVDTANDGREAVDKVVAGTKYQAIFVSKTFEFQIQDFGGKSYCENVKLFDGSTKICTDISENILRFWRENSDSL